MEDKPKVILQGHMDMVYASDLENPDETNAYVKAVVNEKTITSDGKTSLGADDGIGLGMSLAFATSNIPHGPLRILATADEDVGLVGASHLNPKAVDSDYLLNIDSEEYGQITYSSAGGTRISIDGDVDQESLLGTETGVSIAVSGLLGGHSGAVITEKRLSAVTFLRAVANKLVEEKVSFRFAAIDAGYAENALANTGSMDLVVSKSDAEKAMRLATEVGQSLKQEYTIEKNMNVVIEENITITQATTLVATENILGCLNGIKQGVIKMSAEIEGLPQTPTILVSFLFPMGSSMFFVIPEAV